MKLLYILCACTWIGCVAKAQEESVNHVANSSFEVADSIRTDAPAGWVKHPSASAGAWVSDVSHSGKYAVRIDGAGEKGCAWMQEERFQASPGQEWRLNGWVKLDDAWGDNQLRIAWYDHKGKWLKTDRSAPLNGTRDWMRASLDAVAPDGAASGRVVVGRRHQTTSGYSWFDDIELELISGELATDEDGLSVSEIDWSAPRLAPAFWRVLRVEPTPKAEKEAMQWVLAMEPDAWRALGSEQQALSEGGLPMLVLPSKSGSGWITRESFPVHAGRRYEAEALVSYKNALGASAIAIIWEDESGRVISRVYSESVNGTSKVDLLSVRGVAPAAASQARLAFVHRTHEGPVYGSGWSVCQEISIREVPYAYTPVDSLLLNASVEQEMQGNEQPVGWHQVFGEQAVLEHSQNDAQFSGESSLEIRDSHGSAAGWISDTFQVSGGTEYVYHFKVRLEDAYNVYAGIEWYGEDGNTLALTTSGPLSGMLPWSLATLGAKAPATAVNARVFVLQAKSSGLSLFDDFGFRAVGQVGSLLTGEDYLRGVPAIAPSSSQDIVVVQSPGTIDLYIKGSSAASNRWLRYRMQNRPNPDKRSDVWRWSEVWEVERTAPYTFKAIQRLSTDGEIEMAIRQKGKSDFMGGSIHGNEMQTSMSMLVDGAPQALDQSGEFTARRVVFQQTSTLFEVDRSEAVRLAQADRQWTFENGEVVVSQRITWDAEVELVDTYLAMLPLERVGKESLISRYGARSPDWGIEDIAEPGFVVKYSTSDHAIAWSEYGYQAEVEAMDGWDKAGRQFNISPAKIYNKFYFDFTGGGYITKAGEVFESKVRYRLNTSN